jgi:ADP-ribosylglycohydrolase
MLGAIIGDIIGSRWEFHPTNDYNFELFSDKNSFTDDTICTIAVADAILHNSNDYGKYIHEWCRRYPNPMGGYGGSFAQWVRSDNPKPYGSYGNGSAMRVSPVAHWYDNVDDVLDATAATALPSHNHPEGIKGAQTVALAIFKALSYHRYQEAPLHIDEILHECVEFSGYDINMPKASVVNKFDETCQGTVPVALKIISMATCYEDAVRLAVSLGADADTLGAIVGGIAEAIWGIPMKLRHQVEKFLPDDMQTVLHKFRMARPYSYKPLIDTCFSGDDFSDVSWDMLYDIDGKDAHNEIMSKTKSENARKRLLMAERAKARENW